MGGSSSVFCSASSHDKIGQVTSSHDKIGQVTDKTQSAFWEDLHPPLLAMILDRLSVADYLRFAAVCQSWRDVQTDHRVYHATTSYCKKSEMPWLMLLEDELFYNPSEQRSYQISLPKEAEGKYCCGVSHGWLLYVHDITLSEIPAPANNLSLLLVNPFTGSKIDIPILPSMIPSLNLSLGNYNPAIGVLSSLPTDPGCIILLGQLNSGPGYQFLYHVKNKRWTRLHHNQNPLIHHVFCGGTLCWLSPYGGELFFVDTLQASTNVTCFRGPFEVPYSYLVESGGQLLLVRSINFLCPGKKEFEVFKVDLSQMVVEKLESLGDRVLFYNVNWGSLFCITAAETGGPANRIYVTGSGLPSDENPGKLWIEFDYANHRVINTKPLNFVDHSFESSKADVMRWIMPSV